MAGHLNEVVLVIDGFVEEARSVIWRAHGGLDVGVDALTQHPDFRGNVVYVRRLLRMIEQDQYGAAERWCIRVKGALGQLSMPTPANQLLADRGRQSAPPPFYGGSGPRRPTT